MMKRILLLLAFVLLATVNDCGANSETSPNEYGPSAAHEDDQVKSDSSTTTTILHRRYARSFNDKYEQGDNREAASEVRSYRLRRGSNKFGNIMENLSRLGNFMSGGAAAGKYFDQRNGGK